jgi:hypothetical protein
MVAAMNGRPFAVLALTVVDDRIVDLTVHAGSSRCRRGRC